MFLYSTAWLILVADYGIISSLCDAYLLCGAIAEVTIRAASRDICGRYSAEAEGECV